MSKMLLAVLLSSLPAFAKTTFESSNCRTHSAVSFVRDTYAEDAVNRSDCMVLQGLSILAANSFVRGQFVMHEDIVNQDDKGTVDFLNPATGQRESCDYSVTRGQPIAPFILMWLNNELRPDRDGIHSMFEAIEKVRNDVLKSVFIDCGIS